MHRGHCSVVHEALPTVASNLAQSQGYHMACSCIIYGQAKAMLGP